MVSERKEYCIGHHLLGFEYVRVEVHTGWGGEYNSKCPLRQCPVFKIGIGYNTFQEVMNVALHEAIEFCLFRAGCRFMPTNNQSTSTDKFVFMFNHPTLAEISDQISEFIEEVRKPLRKEWKRHLKTGEVES